LRTAARALAALLLDLDPVGHGVNLAAGPRCQEEASRRLPSPIDNLPARR
jgi:hypothetical protein